MCNDSRIEPRRERERGRERELYMSRWGKTRLVLMEKKMFIKVFRPFKATINQPGDFSLWHFVSCSPPVPPIFGGTLAKNWFEFEYNVQYTTMYRPYIYALRVISLPQHNCDRVYSHIWTRPTLCVYYILYW